MIPVRNNGEGRRGFGVKKEATKRVDLMPREGLEGY